MRYDGLILFDLIVGNKSILLRRSGRPIWAAPNNNGPKLTLVIRLGGQTLHLMHHRPLWCGLESRYPLDGRFYLGAFGSEVFFGILVSVGEDGQHLV